MSWTKFSRTKQCLKDIRNACRGFWRLFWADIRWTKKDEDRFQELLRKQWDKVIKTLDVPTCLRGTKMLERPPHGFDPEVIADMAEIIGEELKSAAQAQGDFGPCTCMTAVNEFCPGCKDRSLRGQIDTLDDELVKLFSRRQSLCLELANNRAEASGKSS